MEDCILCVMLCAACGSVTDPNVGSGFDATQPDVSGVVDAPPNACVPFVRIAVQFTVTSITGSGPSSLDVLLNHPNGYVIDVANWSEERGVDVYDNDRFKTAVKASTSYAMDFTGQDEALLDGEIGQHLAIGLAFRGSEVELVDDKSLYLFVLPADQSQHPYMDTRCTNAAFAIDPTGFPILGSFTATGCTVHFYDLRPPAQRHLYAQANSTVEVTYGICP